jgi:RNA polymerase sigma factor (sigma-70 family)
MPCAPVRSAGTLPRPGASLDPIPSEVTRLIGAGAGADMDEAWTAFVAAHSTTLMRVASAFSPGYDEALDRYAYMLDELRRHDCRRLRRFIADGRGRFSTWLTVVARRLCLDHHRRRYGRFHGSGDGLALHARTTRRRLADLTTDVAEVASLEDPAGIDPVDRLASAEQREALSRAVGKLAPADQLLLRLRFEHDLSARQVATLVGLPTPFHVYRRLDALCTILRAQLGGSSPHTGPSVTPAWVKRPKGVRRGIASTCLG